ncbi:EpsG family protein [Vibrio alginolyticus]|uniref:EpsG family protein n=1 Tax=Vibrio alginolyticus TaxID=663 RepID=UPI00375511C4
MNAVNKMYLYFFRLILVSPLFFLFYYPAEFNLDYEAYLINYENDYWRYDVLYVAFSQCLKYLFNLSFDQFLIVYLLVMLMIVPLVYRRFSVIVIAIPSLVSMSQYFYGTQLRYALASLIFLTLLTQAYSSKKHIIVGGVSIFLHYGMAFAMLVMFVSKYIDRGSLYINKIKFWFLFFGSLSSIYIVKEVVIILISYTRFSYYTTDSVYLSFRSISSISYMLVVFVLLAAHYSSTSERKLVDSFIFKFSYVLVIVILVTSPIAVLSSRLNLIYFIIEPLIIFLIFLDKSQLLLVRLLLPFMMLFRVGLDLFFWDFHFYNVL